MLTSREFPVDLADPRARTGNPDPKLVELLTLVGVSDEAGVEILRLRGSADSEADQQWIAERVKGNTFLLAQLAAIGLESPGYLRQHPELVAEEAEPILQAQLMRQSEAARDLLRQMCVLRTGIDIPGLTFLRLYTDDKEKDDRFGTAVKLEKPGKFTKAELKETAEIVRHLVNSSLVQSRYDKERCEWFYDLHRLIVEYLQTAYQAELPQLMERVYKFYCTGKTVENPKTLEDLRPLLEAQYFAFQLGNYDEASSLLMGKIEKYLEPWGYWSLLKNLCEQILPYITDDTNKRICLQSIGIIYRETGNWDKAEKYFGKSLDSAREHNNKSGIAASLRLLGDIARYRGKWDEAEKHFRQSLEIETELDDRAGMASSWILLGYIAESRGKWDEAEKLYQQYLEVMTELDDRAGIASSRASLGYIEKCRGNWDKAEKLYQQCLDLRTELGDRAGMAWSWGQLGDIARYRGNWDKAEELYRKALNLRTELGDRPGMASSWGVLGDIARNRGKWDEAEKLYRQSLDLRTELGDRAGMAETWASLGENELGKGNLDTAEQYLTEALADMENLKMTWHIAETNFDLAKLWRQRGNEEIAQKHYEKSHQLYEKLGAMKDLERIERDWRETGFLI
ncbi:tetratricopeptide repeat protein [Planktothricoides sp. SR001]|nr:tetratricopeptide repeat protein [Planktothricoides sp. SR001]